MSHRTLPFLVVAAAVLAATVLVSTPSPAGAQVINSECYALPDNASELYVLQLDTFNPGPVTIVPLDRTYTGEGMAYDPVQARIYAWRGSSDREMWSIDPLTGDEVQITSDFDDNFDDLNQVQGASVAYDRITRQSTLYVLVDDDGGFYVYEVDTDTGTALNPIGPITGAWTNPASLAIDPTSGTWYVTRDSGTRRLGVLDPTTATITALTNIAGNPDAEGLDFADDSEIYVEEDRGSLGGRHIYQLDKTTGALTVATQTIPGTGDIEGISCNANATVVVDPCSAIGEGAAGNTALTVDVSAGSGDQPITQMVLEVGGSSYIYNWSAGFIRNSTSEPALLESLRIVDDSGGNVRLDEFNFSAADVRWSGYPAGATGIHVSENGVHTQVGTAGFEAALERVYDGSDLRDYLDHASPSPAATTWPSDYSVMFDDPLDEDDFVVAMDRDGDDEYVIEPLDVNGNVIADSHGVRVGGTWRWNTGYAPSDRPDEPVWMTVFDVERFNVTTLLTPIYGFRVNNDADASLKIIGASDRPFTAAPTGGGPVDIQSGVWSGGGSSWSASFGTGTVTAVVSSPPGTISAIGPATMDASDYSEPTVSNAPALAITHKHGTNATLSFDFGRPVTDPVLHLGRIGGYSGNPSQSHSSYLELGGGITWTEIAANDVHLMSTPNAVWRAAGTVLDWRKTGDIGGPTWGTAAGSMRVDGTVSSITMTITNAQPMGVEDLIEFVWTATEVLPGNPPDNGCGTIDASKRSSAATIGVGGIIEWSLDAENTGSLAIRNVVMQDALPPEVRADQLYTGRWSPASQELVFEIEVGGTWTTVGTFDGNDGGTYSLPDGVEQIRATATTDLGSNFRVSDPIRIVSEVIRPDRDGVLYPLPAAIQNCVHWFGDNMANEEQCAASTIQVSTAQPDVTVWNESGPLAPGATATFRIRIENAWAADSPLIAPFLTSLLPPQLAYDSWEPVTAGFTPVLTQHANHDGTGRVLLHWDLDGHQLAPGSVFDLRLHATVAPGTPPGAYALDVLGGTNDTTHEVTCGGATAIDGFDQDLDGDRAESLCAGSVIADTALIGTALDITATSYAEGNPTLPHVPLAGAVGGAIVNGPNLAPGGTATQSSTDLGGVASRAIDGSTNGIWAMGSVTHTEEEDQPYLTVDLGAVYDINEIVLWNRVDCCSDRLSDAWVLVSETPFTSTDPVVAANTDGVLSAYLDGPQGVETHVTVNDLYDGANVISQTKISDTQGGLTAALSNSDNFGNSVAALGDVDGDGVPDIAVGVPEDDTSGGNDGAVFVLLLNADGSVKAETKITEGSGGLTATLGGDRFGWSVAGIGDIDGDGVPDLAVGEYRGDDGGGDQGGVYILFLNADGTVKWEQEISETEGGLGADLDGGDRFGSSVAGIGDLDGDGVRDIVVGAYEDDDGAKDAGALYVLFLHPDGTVKDTQKISATSGGFSADLDKDDNFGIAVTSIGDLDGDGTIDLAVGAHGDDDGAKAAGAVHVLFLNADGTVRDSQKISDTSGGLAASLDKSDFFGVSVGTAGDLDGDGRQELLVGAYRDDDGGKDSGALYVLFLGVDGRVADEQKLSATAGGLSDIGGSRFGSAVAGIGDLDGDGDIDVAVGEYLDDDGGKNRGAVHLIELSGPPTATPRGRYVRVQLTSDDQYLSLAEIEIFEAVEEAACPAAVQAVYSCAAQARSNEVAAFEYEISNDGNVPVDGFTLIAMLPQVGDVGLRSPAPHTSEYRARLIAPPTAIAVPAGGVVEYVYSQSTNPCRPEMNDLALGTAWPAGCVDDWGPLPADVETVTAIKATVSFTGPVKWVGGQRLRIRADVRVGGGSTTADQLGLSSYGYAMNVAATGLTVGAVEGDPAAIIIPRSLNGIGDLVWEDANDDGIQEPGEVGRNDVRVELFRADGTLVTATYSTNLDNDTARPGHYWFGDIAPGTYYVRFAVPPIGLNTVDQDQGVDDALDSDADPLTMRSHLVTIAAGQYDRTVDVGYFVPAGPIDCVAPSDEVDPTDVDADRRQVNDARPCPG